MKHAVVTLLAILTGLTAASAQSVGPPNPIKFCDVCSGFTVSKRGTDVLIRCPGKPIDKPWMTIRECVNPKVDRSQPGNVSINCNLPGPTAQAATTREVVLYRDMQPTADRIMACTNSTGGKG